MFTDYLFYYTNTIDDFNSDVSSECVQYVLSEGYADITTGHLNEHDAASLLNSKEIRL